MSKNSQIRYRKKHPTLTVTCESKQQYANIVEQAKQLNLSISGYLNKVLLEDISSFDEGKRIGSKERDEQWHGYIGGNYVKKEVATNLRGVIKARDATIEDLNETIEEEDEFIASLSDKNISLNNDNTTLRKKNADLDNYIETYLDDAGRREKIACMEEQEKLARYISRLSDLRSELDQRDKDQNKRNEKQDQRDKDQNKHNEEQDQRDKKLSEIQKILADQIHEQQIKRTELEQKKYELEQKEYELKQKRDIIAAEKNDLMVSAEEIGRQLSALYRAEKLRRISVFQ